MPIHTVLHCTVLIWGLYRADFIRAGLGYRAEPICGAVLICETKLNCGVDLRSVLISVTVLIVKCIDWQGWVEL